VQHLDIRVASWDAHLQYLQHTTFCTQIKKIKLNEVLKTSDKSRFMTIEKDAKAIEKKVVVK
jgi:hypothetical protein